LSAKHAKGPERKKRRIARETREKTRKGNRERNLAIFGLKFWRAAAYNPEGVPLHGA
jgi:hypothetical protein